MRETRAEAGWSVLLPPGWTTLPTEPEAARAASKRLIDRMFEGKPRDELVTARIEIDTLLRRQVDQAREAGASFVHALTEPIRGVPVSATLIGVPVQVRTGDDLLDALTEVLGTADGVVESGEDTIGGTFALRRVRRRRGRLDEGVDGPEVTSTYVDYVVPLSADRLLVLAFSTSTDQLRDELVVLFDAIASTLQLDPGD
ncbi:MAG: hypothetical protein ACXV2I_09530, partial [Actinomycetes bacterium]